MTDTKPSRYASPEERAEACRLSWPTPEVKENEEEEAPACRECGSFLTGDKETGTYCPTCNRDDYWRHS